LSGHILLHLREFFRVVSAVVLVVRRRRRAEQSFEFLFLPLLLLHLLLQQGTLRRELAISIGSFIGPRLGISNAPLDHRGIDGVAFGRFLGHEAKPDKYTFDRSEHDEVGS
jgi:hypothetical protein